MNDDPTQVPIGKYLGAHTKANGGWRSFFHSNLFAALVIWLLSQSVIVAGLLITLWLRAAQLSEWKGGVDGRLDRMDAQGTNHSHWVDDEQQKQISSLELRIGKMEGDTAHLDVLESEHRRLTKDVEDLKLKDERKK